tara:strand:+ start:3908 stop:4450 length:543 start_codon:yes stop_codon:yes gene_type:complete
MAITKNYIGYDPLITASEVISLAFTNQNTDTTLISNNLIQMSELAHLKLPLGDEFYLHLKKIYDSGSTDTPTTAENDFMSQWLKPTFAWFVRFEVINEIQDNSTSSGIVSAIPEFSKVVTPKELNVYKQDTYRRGNVMLKAMVDFLDENYAEFPQYNETGGVDCRNVGNAVSKQHGMIIY